MSKATKWTDFNRQIAQQVKWRIVAEEILGLELIGERHGTSGWIKCRSVDGADEHPSAGYNLQTGYYKDWRDGEKAVSSYDLMVQTDKAANFVEAKKMIAKKFGVKWPGASDDDPDAGVKWQPWNDALAEIYCNNKPPITVAGLKRAGARMCMWYKVPCIALPIYDDNIEIVGWMYLPRSGGTFTGGNVDGAKSIAKVQDGVDHGFVTGPDIAGILKDDYRRTVYWTEGAPDMLAGLSKYPNELFITNPNGCSQSVSETQRMMVVEHEHQCIIISDADTPGVKGALKKQAQLRVSNCHYGIAMIPPYPIADKHGKDLRDFLNENEPGDNPKIFLTKPPKELIDKMMPKVANELSGEHEFDEEIAEEAVDKEMEVAMRTMDRVGLQVIGADPTGSFNVYCPHTVSVKTIPNIALTKYANWVQLLGSRFTAYVVETAKEQESIMSGSDSKVITYRNFVKRLAIVCAQRELREYEKVGAGIWPVIDTDGDPTGDVLVIKFGAAYVYRNADKSFVKLNAPIAGRNVCDIGTKYNWFEEDVLASYIQQAQSVEWRNQVYRELFQLFNQWRWENDSMSQVAIGLILATTMQAIHQWRPLVALTGESNSGKTVLMAAIDKLYSGLAQFSARSTAAGILQNMGHSARPLLQDEFDSGTEQKKLMRILRASSRGQETLMGTVNQEGKSYRVNHIPWISGIHASSKDQADLNRMIPLHVVPDPKNARTLEIPDAKHLKNLGAKMIACVITTAETALGITEQLNSTDGDTIQSRYRESYAVPFGCLGALLGLDTSGTRMVMDDYLKQYVVPEVAMSESATDQESLLLDIMQAEVRMPQGSPEEVASVAEILFDNRFEMHRDVARTKGVGYVVSKSSPKSKVAFVGRSLIKRTGVLGNSEWSDVTGILQILERLPSELFPRKEKQMVAGTVTTCVSVDYDALAQWVKSKQVHLHMLKEPKLAMLSSIKQNLGK